jgi:ABC-type multidrug transport system fused ATPase/permease subunit
MYTSQCAHLSVVASTVVLMCIAAPYFILVVIPIGALYYFVQSYYLRTSRELKRLDSITNSPIYSHFLETLTGVTTIRAYNATERFSLENEERLDKNQRCFWPSMSVNRWLGQRLEFVGALMLLIASLFAVLFRDVSDPNLVGLALTYSVSMSGSLNWMVWLVV